MTDLEKALKNHTIEYQVNDLFGWTDIRIHGATPKSNDELKELLVKLTKETK